VTVTGFRGFRGFREFRFLGRPGARGGTQLGSKSATPDLTYPCLLAHFLRYECSKTRLRSGLGAPELDPAKGIPTNNLDGFLERDKKPSCRYRIANRTSQRTI